MTDSKDSPFIVYARCLLTYGQPVELSNDPYKPAALRT